MLRVAPFAHSLATVSAAGYVLCRVLVAVVAPGFFASVAQSWFHGLVVAPSPWLAMGVTEFLLGMVTVAAVAWIFAAAWAWLYNRRAHMV
jgi:hypothetical protein